jgi:hypothetical protein
MFQMDQPDCHAGQAQRDPESSISRGSRITCGVTSPSSMPEQIFLME